jgi:hypothetical protein
MTFLLVLIGDDGGSGTGKQTGRSKSATAEQLAALAVERAQAQASDRFGDARQSGLDTRG